MATRYIDNLKGTSMMTYLRRRKKNITDRILRADGRHFDLELILAQFPKVRFLIAIGSQGTGKQSAMTGNANVASHLCL